MWQGKWWNDKIEWWGKTANLKNNRTQPLDRNEGRKSSDKQKSQEDREVKIPIKTFLPNAHTDSVLQYDSESGFCYFLAGYLKPKWLSAEPHIVSYQQTTYCLSSLKHNREKKSSLDK